MRVHKMGDNEMQAVREFNDACELVLEKEKFSFKGPEEGWTDLDDEDQEPFLRIRKDIAEELDIAESEVDNRIICYEYLKKWYTHRIQLSVMTAEILIDNCCDPHKTYLDFHPSFHQTHVSPEQ